MGNSKVFMRISAEVELNRRLQIKVIENYEKHIIKPFSLKEKQMQFEEFKKHGRDIAG